MTTENPEKETVAASVRAAAVIAAAYAGLQLISNTASLRVGLVAGFAVDMGTFCYPLTFTLRDLAHKVLGKSGATALIWASAIICLFATGYFALCTAAPSAGDDNDAFNTVFSPMWRLVAASIAAMVVSELADTAVYQWFVSRRKDRQWMRVIVSNAVSIPLDNIIFAVGAFAWALPWQTVFEIFIFNLVVKFAVSIAGAPMIYLARDRQVSESRASR